jgi:hypothetical protein
MPLVFVTCFVLGAAALAVWVDRRFPKLAPESLGLQMGVAAVAFVWLQLPVSDASQLRLLLSLFAIGVLPALTTAFLAGMWLVRSLRGAMSLR